MSGKSLQTTLKAKKWLYIDKLALFHGMIIGPHTIFSKSMQIFCDLCYGKCNLFQSSPLLTYSFYLKSVKPCLIPICFTVFCCMAGISKLKKLKQFMNKQLHRLGRIGDFLKGYKLVYIGTFFEAFTATFLAGSFHQKVQIFMEIMIIQ